MKTTMTIVVIGDDGIAVSDFQRDFDPEDLNSTAGQQRIVNMLVSATEDCFEPTPVLKPNSTESQRS